MNRRNYLKSSLGLGTAILLPPGVLALSGCSGGARTPELAGFDGRIMGTSYSVSVFGQVPAGLADAVHATLQDVDGHMSTWRGDAEIARFNDSLDTDWQPMSSATLDVVRRAQSTSKASDGAFDATVGPLVDLWGFGSTGQSGGTPGREAIGQTLAQVGYTSIDIDAERSAVRKRHPNTRLDLSGIAKGHAVDRVAATLDEHGVGAYLAEVGGELRSRGRKPDGSAWRVAIERPEVGRRDVFRVVELTDRAIATSGDYRNFFDAGGQRYSHSIDPRTGRPVDHELASVSVVADTTVEADALSTALMILGPDDAMAFAKRHQVAAQLVLKSRHSLAELTTPAFDALAG